MTIDYYAKSVGLLLVHYQETRGARIAHQSHSNNFTK